MPTFPSPSIITGNDYRPDVLILTKENCLYILELTVGYESNVRDNINRKQSKYEKKIKDKKKKFKPEKFINLSISALGVFKKESAAFLKMLEDIHLDKNHAKYIIKRTINIPIRLTYYMFCRRNMDCMDKTRFIKIVM